MNLAKTKIIQQLGYFPAFLTPAIEFPTIFRNLVQQTFVAYEENPLHTVFKEKLFVYISRYYGVNYFTICHSCTLRSQDISTEEVLALGDIPYPQSSEDIQPDLKILKNLSKITRTGNYLKNFEVCLLRCSSFLFSTPTDSADCAKVLQKFLGVTNYNYLILLLGYIKLCHHWVKDHPQISHEQDRRSQLHLGALLLSQPKLAIFFQSNEVSSSISKQSNKPSLRSKPSSLRLKFQPKVIASKNAASKPPSEILETFSDYSETTQTGTWSWNLESNKIDISDLTYRILGLKNFNGSYKSFFSSVHPDEREFVDLSIIKTINTNQNLDLEYQIIKLNQEVCWVRTRGELDFSETGKVIGLKGIVTSTTQYENQTNLTTANLPKAIDHFEACGGIIFSQQFEQMFEVSPHYTFVVDTTTNAICQINNGLVQACGLSSADEIKGKQIFECFPASYIKQIDWQHQQVLTYGEIVCLQEEVSLIDGTHYFNTIITPIKNAQGHITALLHSSNDIPNLAATQKALSKRTQQLEAANQELESFSYSVSHDLQAPLRVISGFSQALWNTCKDNLDDQGQHFIKRIQANSQKMSDLIDALFEFSQVTRSQMKSVKVNLSTMAEEILQELQAEEPLRQVEIIIEPELEVQGDPQLFRIVLDNLLNNAWKYTSKRSLAKIEFNLLNADDDSVIYFVQDNGAGFDQDYVDKLFTAFQRLHCQSEFPGTGIGLATVQRIIYRHGGRIWAEGESDHGATIYFSL